MPPRPERPPGALIPPARVAPDGAPPRGPGGVRPVPSPGGTGSVPPSPPEAYRGPAPEAYRGAAPEARTAGSGSVPPAPPQPPRPEVPAPPPPAPGVVDPRVGGETGYARGDVAVPPVEGGGGELPAWRWASPPDGPDPAPQDPRPAVRHLGDRAPTYAAEPTSLPAADPAALDFLTPDTVLEGARYGGYTLRAASLRGDSARYRGEARRDFLLTARFGSGDEALVLVVLAGGDRSAPGAREAAAELGHSVAAAVGRSRERLADDIRAGRREALLSGLQRLTDRGYGRLRARAAELGLAEDAYTAGLRGLLLPLDPECPNRVCFGAGAGGLFRLRAGRWQDLEPDDGAGSGGFRFRASVARPGDTLLLCSGGLADPMREEDLLPDELAARWSQGEPPGLAAFLADTQLRLKGYADDRTAAAVWEA